MSPTQAAVTAEPTPNEFPATPIGSFPYGWNGVVATSVGVDGLLDIKPFPQFYQKQFTHQPRTIILGAPRRGYYWMNRVASSAPGVTLTRREVIRGNQTREMRHIVWSDRSLRRVDRVLRKQFTSMTPRAQAELVNVAAARAEQAAA